MNKSDIELSVSDLTDEDIDGVRWVMWTVFQY